MKFCHTSVEKIIMFNSIVFKNMQMLVILSVALLLYIIDSLWVFIQN